MASKKELDQLTVDRSTLANNYLYKNRKAIISWANANGQSGLSFVDKCDAYAHAHGQSDAYKHDVDAFRQVAGQYQKSTYGLNLGDLLA